MTQTAAQPTSKQLAYLRSLAQRTGETFTYPHTKAQASAEIRRLRSRETSSPQERRREQRDIARELAERPDDVVRVNLDHETTGYLARATWR